MRISDLSSDVCSSNLVAVQQNVFCRVTRVMGDNRRLYQADFLNGCRDLGILCASAYLVCHGVKRPYIRESDANPGCLEAHRDLLAICGFSHRSEEHTSELQSLMRISYAVFCLKKKTNITT